MRLACICLNNNVFHTVTWMRVSAADAISFCIMNFIMLEILMQLHEWFRFHDFFLTMFFFLFFLYSSVAEINRLKHLTVSVNLYFSHYFQFQLASLYMPIVL